MAKATKEITTSSTAEYFAKNLQQVGFSSATKAVLTTVKEAVDNALDACEEAEILPEITIELEKIGKGNLKNTDRVRIMVEDNGPGIDPKNVPKVFGEYLASSKFGRGRCSRGQQGIGISAATTWAIQTTAKGARVLTKQSNQRKALKCVVATDLKNNKGILTEKDNVDWDKPHGTRVEFIIDGRIQLNGEAGILNYIRGNVLLNPHLTLHYKISDMEPTSIERVSNECPAIPEATAPHPHTMKLGEFISHARLYGKVTVKEWFKKGFSRVNEKVLEEIIQLSKLPKNTDKKALSSVSNEEFRKLFSGVQDSKLQAPPTSSVMSVGEEGLALSIRRLGDIDFFAVVSRKPMICDYKPIQVEVAVARIKDSHSVEDNSVQVLRFANRVPLQFDKASCAIVKAITTVNWKSYGLRQTKGSVPAGPYVIAVSVVSPFIKFKNASKETIDAADELVEEIRRALMVAGQRLSRHLKREQKSSELEAKIQHIEKFSPILVETLCRILSAPESRKIAAEEGLKKILARDSKATEKELSAAEKRLVEHLESQKQRLSGFREEDEKLLEDEGLEFIDVDQDEESSESEAPIREQLKNAQTEKKNKVKKVVNQKPTTKKKTASKKKLSKKEVQTKKVTNKKKSTKTKVASGKKKSVKKSKK